VTWIKAAVAAFMPEQNILLLDGCRHVKYQQLVVCPGIKLDWDKIEGLSETLGRNGVTSNYRFDLAPYTWELVQSFKGGKALFTQPPMPIKCAGAPQKAMYLSSDHWTKSGVLNNIEIDFYNAGAVLFGVKDYVPALMKYIEKYKINAHFTHELIAVDGDKKVARFKAVSGEKVEIIEKEFDMLHVVPPQSPPDFIKVSPLADDAGWIDVDQSTLRHKKFSNIYSLGDATNAPNAKTAAAARMQAPVVAANLLHDRGMNIDRAIYNGYGSCPLTVERGKIVLAEFGYGGKILSSFPSWLINGTKPSRLAWYLKEKLLPPLYWKGMLKGKEWLAKPKKPESV
jgi:sulfide:quinone oxidoreductase